jgi:transposase
MARAKARGRRVGRPRRQANFKTTEGLSVREAAFRLGVSMSVVARWRMSQKGEGKGWSAGSTIQ